MIGEYRIRRAVGADVDAIVRLLAELTVWLAELGTDQWQQSHERRRALIEADVRDGLMWVVHDDRSRQVATVTVDGFADADFWEAEDGPTNAVYVHRMAVARTHAGCGLGSAMLDWAAEIAESVGRHFVRFDAWSTNEALHLHYKSLEFDMVRNHPVHGRGSGALFERLASLRTGGPLFVPADRAAREVVHGRRERGCIDGMDLSDFTEMSRTESGLVSVATARKDGSIQATVVNAGVLAHPVTGDDVLGFVAGGRGKLVNLRARPWTTVTVRSGWRWASVEGTTQLAGPDDTLDGVDDVPLLMREIFTAAGGTHDDWAGFDAAMAQERRVAVLVRPDRVYGV